tara:strand:+ start:747 stop:1235 length:489 start_codon:yes stop_codon:yes gene_type:complete
MIEVNTITFFAPISLIICLLIWYLIMRISKLNQEKTFLYQKIIDIENKKEVMIEKVRQDSVKRQRSIIKGDISETIAPWSITVVNSVKELSFIGNPIDFVGFKGLDYDGEVEIKFIEVKSGKSQLNKNQRRIRDAVVAKRIEWIEVRVKDLEIEIEEKTICS